MNKFKTILFWYKRNHTNLGGKWWHRLFIVCYFVASIILFIYLASSSNFKFFDHPQWELSDTFSNRINSSLQSVNELAKTGEKIDELGASSYSLNSPDAFWDFDMTAKTFCSSQIGSYIEQISDRWSVNSYYISGKNVPLNQFEEHLRTEDVNCVIIDSYSNYNSQNVLTSKLDFLRTDKDLLFDKLSTDYGFYQVSDTKTLLFQIANLLTCLIITLILMYIVAIAYYKLFLYIVLGNMRNKHE